MADAVAGSPEPGRVERAADREMRRYVLYTTLFVVLAVVPLALAYYYYVYGRTDRQLVTEEVRKGVAPIEAIAHQAEPVLAQVQSTARQVAQQQERVATLLEDQGKVQERVTQLSERLPQVEASAARAQELSVAVTELRSNLENQNSRIASVAAEQTRLSQNQARIDSNLKDLSVRVTQLSPARLDELMQRFNEIDGRVRIMDRRLRERVVNPPR